MMAHQYFIDLMSHQKALITMTQRQFLLAIYLLFQPTTYPLTLKSPSASTKRSEFALRSTRRDFLQENFAVILGAGSTSILCWPPSGSMAVEKENLQDYPYSKTWRGTSLELLSFEKAANLAQKEDQLSTFPMGRWPDPILRRQASPVNLLSASDRSSARSIAYALRRTARKSGAVGLAAQQCAVDVRMIFLDDPKILASKSKGLDQINTGGTFLLNPRIVARSSEMDMQVWNEECLVLPPTFRATVLRDAFVAVEHETLDGETKTIELSGELARCLQHELDHDRGILITDHVGLNELESDDMRKIEQEGHDSRQVLAYSRFVAEQTVMGNSNKALFAEWRGQLVPPANAAEEETVGKPTKSAEPTTITPSASATNDSTSLNCDEKCIQERKRRIAERRAMMNQSRSNTKRSDLFELSKQRAALYGTNYQGASCPPGIPCI